MTPHVSGATEGTLEARAKVIADNIERITRGAPPFNAITPIA
jgi:phosphoglycerate dehydrogenase-like enzyme